MASAELLLHPVRLRIVQAFLGDRTLTTAQLAAELGDVPPASLYRHVALLTKAGVLQVAAERRVRAVVERTYMLRAHAAQVQPDEAAAMSPEQHLAAFMAYAAGMLADVERYLTTGTPDPQRDGASYRVGAMWLSDAEHAELVRDLVAVFQPRLANPPAKGRRRRTLYNVSVPAPEDPGPRTPTRTARAAEAPTPATRGRSGRGEGGGS
ncbi:helix-turn-helix domain-containing protein [Acidimicrobiaceae bacterium USS-CC1]|uniref:Helix-turn-helix domain-containing protein n=1 Tax=Acidiferrimicrobium australe TaxID=2664430 RepID=A0ABW9QUU1_9ACTN|nr:helix-turn-helix domain-containing protein [Acidiferrimicrobium australe]